MARPDVLNRLKELGWDGPTSYTLPYLLEMTALLEGGTTVEQLKESRRKTSVKVDKQPRGTWVQVTEETPAPDGAETREVSIMVPGPDGEPVVGGTMVEYFVPEVKQPKAKKEKGTWEPCDARNHEFTEPQGEVEQEGTRYRWTTGVKVLVEGEPEQPHVHWEKFVPTPPKAKGKLKGQEASWDPREMLRAFENEDVRIRTGGRDWTMVDVDFLDLQLKGAQETGAAAVVIELDGSQESADVVWLEALVAVKRRLALRETQEVNGDGVAQESTGDSQG